MKNDFCFVIMGFGERTDFSIGKKYDLNHTYKAIIKPAVQSVGLKCVRADEVQGSDLIDKSMYAMLMSAKLVIADISTFNPNAIYELGIRHALKPYSTIILNVDDATIPFDLSHNRIIRYKHGGTEIKKIEIDRCKKELSSLIQHIINHPKTDSPLYEFINELKPPTIDTSELEKILKGLLDREDKLFSITEKAEINKAESNFFEAAKLWNKARTMIPHETYFTQQAALCTYKSKIPSELDALIKALEIIKELDIENTNDPETLGIAGAIYKNLYWLTKDKTQLNNAIDSYKRGFVLSNDYYTGENYALCLDLKAENEKERDEKTYLKVEARKCREKIIEIVESYISDSDDKDSIDKWMYATLSHCYLALGKVEQSENYEKQFLFKKPASWEIETYNKNKQKIK